MNEKQILKLNAEPWYLCKMSEEELLDTAALAKSMLNEADPLLHNEITRLIQQCESLAAECQQNRLKETLWFH